MYENLLSSLAAARGRDLPDILCRSLNELFEEMGEKNAHTIVNQLTLADSLPTNLYGAVRSRWIELKNSQGKIDNWKDNWPAEKECANPNEWRLFFDIMTEIMLWHQLGLAIRNRDGLTEPISIDEWVTRGKPKTWSNILDHFLDGYADAHEEDLQHLGALEKFMDRYLKLLKAERDKRNIAQLP